MLSVAYLFASVVVSWYTALFLIRMRSAEIAYRAIPTGAGCALIALLLYHFSAEAFIPLTTLLFFLVTAAVLPLRRDFSRGDSVLALLTAAGSTALFQLAGRQLCGGYGPVLGPCLGFVLAASFLLLSLRLRRSFPEKGWREQFTALAPPLCGIQFRIWHIYAALALGCLLTVGADILLPLLPPGGAWISIAGFSCVYWGGLLCAVLMVRCQQGTMEASIEQQYRSEMQTYMSVIRSQRHDFNFHVQALARLFSEGSHEDCQKYVDYLQQDAAAINAVLPVKEAAVAAVLNSFLTLAGQAGITLHIDIQDDLARVVTNVYETNKIISNLLQNAIDEVRTHEDRSYGIRLYIFKRDQYAVIHVANELGGKRIDAEDMTRMFQQGYTTKAGHTGVGLSSIKSLLTRKNGLLTIKCTENVIHFVARIPVLVHTREETADDWQEAADK